METHFFTFGQSHRHEINGVVFDRDCIASINAESYEAARDIALELFGNKFCFQYQYPTIDEQLTSIFPRGIIPICIMGKTNKDKGNSSDLVVLDKIWIDTLGGQHYLRLDWSNDRHHSILMGSLKPEDVRRCFIYAAQVIDNARLGGNL